MLDATWEDVSGTILPLDGFIDPYGQDPGFLIPFRVSSGIRKTIMIFVSNPFMDVNGRLKFSFFD